MLHDILVDLLPKVDLKVRRQLSEQLGAMTKPPPELMSLLVHDVIEVSGPLLEHAAVSEEDLIDVVKVGNDAHREKIARRQELPPQVRDALEKIRVKATNPSVDHNEPAAETKSSTEPKKSPRTQGLSSLPRFFTEDQKPDETAVNETIKQAKLFEDIIRSAVDWIWETGRDGEIKYLSDSSIRAFGRPAKILKGLQLADYCSLSNQVSPVNTLEEILNHRRPFRDLIISTRDTVEQLRTWRLSGVPCFDLETGRFTGFRGTAHEVPEQKAAPSPVQPPKDHIKNEPESSFLPHEIFIPPIAQNIDKDAAELIQTLSHELRTPLNAILGFSEMIDHETWGPLSENYHDKTKVILRSAYNLKKAITDVLDVAKIRAGKQHVNPKFFSLAATLKASLDAVRIDAEAQKIILSPLHLPRDVPFLNDPEYLGRCIAKILTYVINRADPGDKLWINAHQSADHMVDIDIPLLGPKPSFGKKSALLEDENTEQREEEVSVAFSLSVAADLALAIGGKIRIISQNNQNPILRLTIGDYPINMPETEA